MNLLRSWIRSQFLALILLTIDLGLVTILYLQHERYQAERLQCKANVRTATTRPPVTVSAEAQAPPISAPAAFHWSQLAPHDYRAYIMRLRVAGCPETTIQDIIIGAINRQFQPKITALRQGARKFWQPLQRLKPAEQQERMQREQAVRQLEQQRSQLIAELLGIQPADYAASSSGKIDRLEELLTAVSDTARVSARAILEKFNQQESDVLQRANGTLGPTEQRQLLELYRQKTVELRKILSPQELEEYELRASPTAQTLRNSELVGFSPTEQEFRQIFKIRKEFDEEFGFDALAPNTTNSGRLQMAQQMMEERLRQALGEDRYADYRRSQDYTYRRLVEFTDYHGLPADTAVQVHALRENYIQQVDAIGSDQIDLVNRQAMLNRMQTEATKAVEQMLGIQAYKEYAAAPFGQWINLLPTWTNGVVFGH